MNKLNWLNILCFWLFKKDEYIYAPKCGTDNDYVYDDCTVKIKVCGEAKKEDTSDYKNIII